MAGLFGAPRRYRGPRERAAERQVSAWHKAGHTVDATTSSALRAAAEACDMAQRAAAEGESSPLSYARAVAIWWQVYREACPPPVPDVDEVDQALAQLLAAADDATDG